MTVNVEHLEGLERRVTVTVPSEQVEKEIDKRITELAPKVNIHGFRPGKVPPSVVRQRYEPSVRGEVVSDVVQKSFYDVLDQEKLQPAGQPRLELTKADKGQSLEYVATFEVFPDIKLVTLAGKKIKKSAATVTDTDIDKMIENIRGQHKEWVEVERVAKDGDQIEFDFLGTVDGESFEGGKAENFKLELGSGQMIPGFEDGLIGLKAGDKSDLPVTFPDDYGVKDLTGKKASFAITTHKVFEAKLPEINEDFVKKLDIEGGTVDALRADARKNMERELTRVLADQIKADALKLLWELNPIDLPKALVDSETEKMHQQTMQSYAQHGANAPELPKENFTEDAKRQISYGLLLAEVIKKHKLMADAKKVRVKVEELASSYKQPEQIIAWYYGDEKKLHQVESIVLEEAAIEMLLADAKIEEQQQSYDEVMSPKPETKKEK